MPHPSFAIFIKSYRGDREFLGYALRSLKKFGSGYSEIVVVLDESDKPHFANFDSHGARLVYGPDPSGDPYMFQQCVKMHADTYTDADLIFHTDSDAFAMEPFDVREYCGLSGKPKCLFSEWSDVGEAICWRDPMEKFFQTPARFEFMRILPTVYPRHVYPALRQFCSDTHGVDVTAYVLAQKDRSFSEFNALSGFCHLFAPDVLDWGRANVETDGYPRHFFQQWSWQPGGVDRHKAQYEEILAQN